RRAEAARQRAARRERRGPAALAHEPARCDPRLPRLLAVTDAPAPPTFGAVILAGGKSSRMGKPKAWLPWRGKPLLAHIVDVVAACDHPLVVVGAPGMELPPLHPSAVRVDDPTEFEHGGPLVGLFAGLGVLAAHHTDFAYLGACDNLFLTPDYLRLLFDNLVA